MDKDKKKKIVVRLSKIEGHIKSIKNMVEEDKKSCKDILIQLLAVKNAITSVSKIMVLNSIENCIDGCGKEDESYENVKEFIKKYIS